jgi:hypothetical protein
MNTPTVAVRERPILFSGPMVRAILDGRKTQTRRVVKPQPDAGPNGTMVDLGGASFGLLDGSLSGEWRCPFGAPGDRLWVRETFYDYDAGEPAPQGATDFHTDALLDERIEYRATPWTHEFADPEECGPWTSSIHMPRWASRITLEVTDVRVGRVQAITAADCIAEGIASRGMDSNGPNIASAMMYIEDYKTLWDSLNAKRGYGWNVNPWAWAVSFARVTT